MNNYWQEITPEILEEVGISFTEAQAKRLAGLIDGCSGVEAQYTGEEIAGINLIEQTRTEENNEIKELKEIINKYELAGLNVDGKGVYKMENVPFSSTHYSDEKVYF